MKRIFLYALLMVCSHHTIWAGGFKLGLQGTKQLGMGHTGVGFAQDAATIYFNPAGMSFVGNQLNGGINLLVPNTSYLDANTNQITNVTGNVYTPFSLYAKGNLSKKIAVGLGIYTPFGSGVHYPYEWTGRFVLTDVSLSTVFIQPSLSIKIAPKWSIGAGYVIARGRFVLEKDIPLYSQTNKEYAHAKLEGNAKGNGYNLGLYFHSGKALDFGIAYHSRVNMAVKKGTTTFSSIPTAAASQFPANNTFTTDLALPSELSAGFSYKLSKHVTAALDVNYTYWKSYDSLGFNYEKNTATLSDKKSPRLYKNAVGFKAGIQAHLADNLDGRIGAFYDKTPVPNGYVAPELPDNNKIALTCGISYQIRNYLSADVALLYEDVAKRSEINLESGMNGTYKTKAIAPAFGLVYKFVTHEKRSKKYKPRY